MRLPSALAATAVAVLCVLAITGCGGSATSATTRAASSSKGLRPQKSVEATRLGPDGTPRPNFPKGARVGKRFSGTRAFANSRDGFAIGTPPGDLGATYPIATADGGKTWRIAGPILHIPAAQGALAVDAAGMSSPHVWYAWSDGNTVVDVTPDAGKHWWQAFLPGQVLTVYADQIQCNRLIALVQPFIQRKHPPLWTYASATGHHWTYVANTNAATDC